METIQNYAVEICFVLIVLCALLVLICCAYHHQLKAEKEKIDYLLKRWSDDVCALNEKIIQLKTSLQASKNMCNEISDISEEVHQLNKELLSSAQKWQDYEEQQRQLKDKKQIQACNQQRDSKGRFSKKGEFVLPEKWVIKTNTKTRKIVSDFIQSKGYSCSLCVDYYVHFPFLDQKNKTSAYTVIKNGYTEITFDQFKKYVLKEN